MIVLGSLLILGAGFSAQAASALQATDTDNACLYGRFANPLYFVVGRNPHGVATADFDHNGHLDLAVALKGELGMGYGVDVLLGNGDGSFQAAVTYQADRGPDGVAAADFNGDTHPDLVVTNYSSGDYLEPAKVSILLGKGDGTFNDPTNYLVGYGPTSVAVADLNKDGKLDLAVTNWGNTNSVSVLLGAGNGAFQAAVDYAAGNGPYFVTVGEFNGDNILDLAVANFRYNDVESTVSILLGNGNGAFAPPTNIGVGSQPASVAVADFNGDTLSDLAVGDFSSGRVSILVGNGDGSFQSFDNYGASSPGSVVVADFNDDTFIDLAVAGGSLLTVRMGNGNAVFGSPIFYSVEETLGGALVADFNGDQRPDLAIAGGKSDHVSLWLNSCWWNCYLPATLRS
ncbi:MAG: VCBS repeat-containing protein [Caldilineaceae bacterium]|nr:VCBS repeat-containing protein [Caldilineaceae bacterium]